MSCDECSFPGPEVHLLVQGGSTAAEQAFSVALTAANVASASVYPSQGGGGGGGRPASPPPPSPQPSHRSGHKGHPQHRGRLALTLGAVHAPRLRKLLAKGLSVRPRCSLTCHLTLRLTLDARTSRRYGLGARSRRGRTDRARSRVVTVGGAKVTLKGGRATKVRVRFNRPARHALRRARRLTLRLRIVARGGGKRATLSRKVKVKR